jgi:hypothetical protein
MCTKHGERSVISVRRPLLSLLHTSEGGVEGVRHEVLSEGYDQAVHVHRGRPRRGHAAAVVSRLAVRKGAE